MHGMWPSNNDGSYPDYCNSSDVFNPNDLESIIVPLREAWYDFDGPNSTSLWDHEFSKHGTCMRAVLPTELDFFSAGITVHHYMNITATLAAANIVPSRTKSYTLSQLTNALSNRFPGITPILTCAEVYNKNCISIIEYCMQVTSDVNPPQVFQCASEFLQQNPSNCPKSDIYFPTIDFGTPPPGAF